MGFSRQNTGAGCRALLQVPNKRWWKENGTSALPAVAENRSPSPHCVEELCVKQLTVVWKAYALKPISWAHISTFFILTVWPWTSYLTSLYLSFLTIKCKLKIVPTIYVGEGHGNPLQYSRLENPMDRGACWATVHGVTKSWTQLKRLSTHTHQPYKVFMRLTVFPDGYGFADGSAGKESVWIAGDTRNVGLIPGLGRPTQGNGNLLQYPCLENSTDRGARLAIVQWVSKSWTRLND